MRKRRHLFRGIVAGILIGVALGLLSMIYGINSLGVITPYVAVLLGIVIGILVAFVPSRKAMRARSNL